MGIWIKGGVLAIVGVLLFSAGVSDGQRRQLIIAQRDQLARAAADNTALATALHDAADKLDASSAALGAYSATVAAAGASLQNSAKGIQNALESNRGWANTAVPAAVRDELQKHTDVRARQGGNTNGARAAH